MTNPRVRNIAEASRDEWLAAARACPYATYFHTPYWYDLIAPGQNHTALSISFNDGASALIPIAKITRMGGLLVDHFSSPGGTYGGWISESALGEEHVRALVDILLSKKNLTFRVNPFDEKSLSVISLLTALSPATKQSSTESSPVIPPSIQPSIQPSTSITLTDDFTHTLDLTKDADALFGALSRGHKSSIKNAERGGVTVRTAENAEDWERYYRLYLSSLERWRAGGPERKTRTVYPLALFRRLRENLTGNEALWLALIDGEPVSGALVFYWGRHAVYWHGAASERGFRLRPNNLLFWEIIKDAQRRGCEIFDFNPSGGYSGAESFKDRFGAARTPAPVIITRTTPRKIIKFAAAASRIN